MAKVRITTIHPADAHYDDRDELIGQVGTANNILESGHGLFSFLFKGTTFTVYLIHAGIQLLDRKVRHHGEDISD